MNKSLIVVGAVVVLVGVGVVWWMNGAAVVPQGTDYQSATYLIDGQSVTLWDGRAETSAVPDSASQIVTQYFGNETTGDLNGDGVSDVAFILTQSGAGSGTFYYAVVALKTADGYQGTNAILLGDRIALQTTEIQNGQVIVNYADRAPGEPMTTQPSLGVSRFFSVQGTELTEALTIAGVGQRCGGNTRFAPVCVSGYHCAPVPGSNLQFGDVGGTCIAD